MIFAEYAKEDLFMPCFEKIKNDGMKGKEASILALMVVVASMVAMIAVICVKSVWCCLNSTKHWTFTLRNRNIATKKK